MNFDDPNHNTVDLPDCFRLLGPKRAPLSRNRVDWYQPIVKNALSVILCLAEQLSLWYGASGVVSSRLDGGNIV